MPRRLIGGLIQAAVPLTDPALPILVLSMHDEAVYAERALRPGTNGYIMKQEATDKVLVALRRILTGDVYVSDRFAAKLLGRMVAQPKHARQTPVASLSDRELEVFQRARAGSSGAAGGPPPRPRARPASLPFPPVGRP